MTLPRRARAAAVAVVLLLAACGSDNDTAAGTTTTAVLVSTTTTASTEAVTEPRVQVVDPGAEPRRRLRIAPAPGSEQKLTLRLAQEQQINIDGQTSAAPAPITEMDMKYKIRSIDDQVISTEVLYEDTRVADPNGADPQTIDLVERTLAAFEGERMEVAYTDRGAVRSSTPFDVEFPDEMKAMGDLLLSSISDQLTALAIPFPEEPIGSGATWRVHTTAVLAGLAFDVTADVKGVHLKADQVEGTLALTMALVPGETEISGVAAEVERGVLSGGGTIRWDLTGVSPYVTQEIGGTTVLTVKGDEDPVRIEQTQRIELVTRPR